MPLLNVLFWNVQKKDLTAQITNLAHSKDVDILVLAENPVPSELLTQSLNQRVGGYHANHPTSRCEKITIVSRFSYEFIKPVTETKRLTVRRIQLPGCPEFLLTALHLPDKMSASPDSQNEHASRVAAQLLIEEIHANLDRHLIVGDFNMNPFEVGMIKANGFHGTMSSVIARRGSRIVQGEEFPYFYNPTWSLYGDSNKAASGTYYYKSAEFVCYEWNVFDQVLLRASLIPNFVKESLNVIQHDGVTSLLTRKDRPNKVAYSDHLPLFFTLSF